MEKRLKLLYLFMAFVFFSEVGRNLVGLSDDVGFWFRFGAEESGRSEWSGLGRFFTMASESGSRNEIETFRHFRLSRFAKFEFPFHDSDMNVEL